MKCAIGIDPDSSGLVCALVNAGTAQVITRSFLATKEGLAELLRWVRRQGQVLVAVEGTHGQSQPIEKAFREAGIVFYSFRPADTDKFRKAVLGQNKDNRRDAESVARYALALESQGRLERYKRVWFPDMNLQLLTRRWESLSHQITAEVNRLWKLLRYASVDLYLALGGKNPQVDCAEQKGLKYRAFSTCLPPSPISEPGKPSLMSSSSRPWAQATTRADQPSSPTSDPSCRASRRSLPPWLCY
jgi:hypothetical protein